VIHGVLGASLGFVTAGAPDAQGHRAAVDQTTDEDRSEVAEVIGVQMADEQLVQVVLRDQQRRQVVGRRRADVEDKLFAVAELDQPARGSLRRSLIRHAGSARDDPHLVLRQLLRVRVVDPAGGGCLDLRLGGMSRILACRPCANQVSHEYRHRHCGQHREGADLNAHQLAPFA
jgi:hypothetical protein